jgi:hypothetical protein
VTKGLISLTGASGYSLFGNRPTTRSDNGESKVEAQQAYAYLRRHLLMFESEVNRTKQRLTYFAVESGFELSATFVEEVETGPLAFERLLQAVIRDKVEVVILPSMLHFAVLGAPTHVKDYFEAATEARVVTILGAVPREPELLPRTPTLLRRTLRPCTRPTGEAVDPSARDHRG